MVYPLRLAAASTNSCCPTNREPGIGSSPDKRGSQYRLHQVRCWPKARPDAIAELARLAKQAASENGQGCSIAGSCPTAPMVMFCREFLARWNMAHLNFRKTHGGTLGARAACAAGLCWQSMDSGDEPLFGC